MIWATWLTWLWYVLKLNLKTEKSIKGTNYDQTNGLATNNVTCSNARPRMNESLINKYSWRREMTWRHVSYKKQETQS
jgi:hypothetical protein